MQVDVSTALGFFASVISVAVAAWFGVARYAIAQREREIDRRLDDCRNECRQLNDRLHTEEKATIRQDGDVARVRDSHGTMVSDIEEIKRTMVSKSEVVALEKAINQVHNDLARSRGGSGAGAYSAIPQPFPKKPDVR